MYIVRLNTYANCLMVGSKHTSGYTVAIRYYYKILHILIISLQRRKYLLSSSDQTTIRLKFIQKNGTTMDRLNEIIRSRKFNKISQTWKEMESRILFYKCNRYHLLDHLIGCNLVFWVCDNSTPYLTRYNHTLNHQNVCLHQQVASSFAIIK